MYADKKICFIALRAYPLLAKKNMGCKEVNIGYCGPDVLQTLLAKALVEHDFKISFVVYGKPLSIEYVDGIEIIKVPETKLKTSKAILIWNAMRKADADIYYHHGGATPIVSLFAKLHKKKFVCHIASDKCVMKNTNSNYRLWGLDIKLADVIIVQSEFQKLMLRKNFHRNGILIRNFFPITEKNPPVKADPPVVIWVGAMSWVKQPLLFLKLAKRIPDGKFQMIGGIGDDRKLYEFVKKGSKMMSNVDFLGHIPFHEIDEYFEKASILVNTSHFEGYPNAFIQAWANYTPVVSLKADPDEVICRYKLGFHSKTFEQLIRDVKILLKNEQLRREMGENARRYVEKEHNSTNIINKYLTVYNCLL